MPVSAGNCCRSPDILTWYGPRDLTALYGSGYIIVHVLQLASTSSIDLRSSTYWSYSCLWPARADAAVARLLVYVCSKRPGI